MRSISAALRLCGGNSDDRTGPDRTAPLVGHELPPVNAVADRSGKPPSSGRAAGQYGVTERKHACGLRS